MVPSLPNRSVDICVSWDRMHELSPGKPVERLFFCGRFYDWSDMYAIKMRSACRNIGRFRCQLYPAASRVKMVT
jgi:hypothetical protein